MSQVLPVLEPASPGGLIDEFLASLGIQHPEARPILHGSMLPPSLENHVRSLGDGCAWRAWEHDRRLRFVVVQPGRMRIVVGQIRQVMDAYFYDASARLLSCGRWMRQESGHWEFMDRVDTAAR
jgi:hypothetical protein